MISIAPQLQKCKFQINPIQGLNFQLDVMNGFGNSQICDFFSDLVKNETRLDAEFFKPVISQFGQRRVAMLGPSAFIEREKKKLNFPSFKCSFILKPFVLSP